MKPLIASLILAALMPGSALLAQDHAQLSPPAKRVLFFTKSAGYEHSIIRDPSKPFSGSETPGLAFIVLKELGRKNNIEFVFSKDGSLFNPHYLAQFDAFFFCTTGVLTEVGTDGNPPMSQAGKEAFLKAIEGGKGFIGSHCASDTFHSGAGYKDLDQTRWLADGDKADPYIKMLGGEFIIHGRQQQSHLIVADPKFPGVSAVPADNNLTEEWYSLKNFAPDIHVILVQDTSHMEGAPYARANYPETWARKYGAGRVFYTTLAHRDDTWRSEMFQSILAGGINWALGRVDADLTPNLEQAAPQANVLPKHP